MNARYVRRFTSLLLKRVITAVSVSVRLLFAYLQTIELQVMGAKNGPYREEFPAGMRVRVKDSAVLQRFRREWKFHHPLTDEQMAFASRVATVQSVSFYHGGDELYALVDVPGRWHEQLLEAV